MKCTEIMILFVYLFINDLVVENITTTKNCWIKSLQIFGQSNYQKIDFKSVDVGGCERERLPQKYAYYYLQFVFRRLCQLWSLSVFSPALEFWDYLLWLLPFLWPASRWISCEQSRDEMHASVVTSTNLSTSLTTVVSGTTSTFSCANTIQRWSWNYPSR